VCTTGDTSNSSSCQKKLFQFSCGCEKFHKVGPLVFLLERFIITENIMKRPVLLAGSYILYLHIIMCDILIYNYTCSFLPMSAFHIVHVTA
jgi:hypothetical protein